MTLGAADLLDRLPDGARVLFSGLSEEEMAALSLDDAGVTSLQVLRLVMDLENAYGIQFEDEELLGMSRRSLAAIATLTRGKVR